MQQSGKVTWTQDKKRNQKKQILWTLMYTDKLLCCTGGKVDLSAHTPLAQELGKVRKGTDKQKKVKKPMTFLQLAKVHLVIF